MITLKFVTCLTSTLHHEIGFVKQLEGHFLPIDTQDVKTESKHNSTDVYVTFSSLTQAQQNNLHHMSLYQVTPVEDNPVSTLTMPEIHVWVNGKDVTHTLPQHNTYANYTTWQNAFYTELNNLRIKVKLTEIKKLLSSEFPGEVTFSKGTLVIKRTFFYRHGRDEDQLKNKVKTFLESKGYTNLSYTCEEVYRSWPKDSYWKVVITL